jgi:hypothetical protein
MLLLEMRNVMDSFVALYANKPTKRPTPPCVDMETIWFLKVNSLYCYLIHIKFI